MHVLVISINMCVNKCKNKKQIPKQILHEMMQGRIEFESQGLNRSTTTGMGSLWDSKTQKKIHFQHQAQKQHWYNTKNVLVRYVFRLIAEHIGLIRSINIDKNTGGDHPDISPASPGTFDLHLDTQDLFISKDKLDNFALCSIR